MANHNRRRGGRQFGGLCYCSPLGVVTGMVAVCRGALGLNYLVSWRDLGIITPSIAGAALRFRSHRPPSWTDIQ